MIGILLLVAIVILAVAFIATRPRVHSPTAMSEREAADRLRVRSGAVEFAPQQPPIEEGEE